MIKRTKAGHYVIREDTHISEWVEESGRLDCCGQLLPEIIKLIKPGMSVLDIGAFIGDHSYAYLKAVGPEGMVYSIEPNPEAFACLVLNCQEYKNFRPFCLSLGDIQGFYSLMRENNAGMTHVLPGGKIPDTFTLRVDNYYFPHVDLIKIDAEGSESDILDGMRDYIENHLPILVIEVNQKALCRRGAEFGHIQCMIELLGYEWDVATPEMAYNDDLFDIIAIPKSK